MCAKVCVCMWVTVTVKEFITIQRVTINRSLVVTVELLRQVPTFRVQSVDSGALSVALINHDLFQSFRVLYRPLGQSPVFLVSTTIMHHGL